MKRLFLALFLLSSPCLGKPQVVTTFSILGDIVKAIGQDKVDVKSLVGPNQDSHVYEPVPQDAKALNEADLVIINGLGFEKWMQRLIATSGYKGKIVVASEGVKPLIHTFKNKDIPDPHAWLSLKQAPIYVDNIVKGLSEIDPTNAHFYLAQGETYKRNLKLLDKQIDAEFQKIPIERRKIITTHDAFGYMGQDFKITFYSPLGMSTDAEPSAKAIARLIEQIRGGDVQALFVENISNPRLMEQISQETGVKIGGTLYSDALSYPDNEADSYIKMMRFNLTSILKALSKEH